MVLMSSRINRTRKKRLSMRAASRTRRTLRLRWGTTSTSERTEATWRMMRATASSKSMFNRVETKSSLLLVRMND
jgi:hypothetical protein